jgi:hypothetical protein
MSLATESQEYARDARPSLLGRTLGRYEVLTRLALLDVTDPESPVLRGSAAVAGGTRAVRIVRVYNPPFLQTFAVTAHDAGIEIFDISRPASPTRLGTVDQVSGAFDLDVEEFGLDRTVDGRGLPIMAVSHEGARWLDQSEFLRVIGIPVFGSDLGTDGGREGDDR